MSMYNMMHGHDPNAKLVMHFLELDPREIERFRDAYPDPKKDLLVVLTRTGGANRESYVYSNAKLAAHPLYIRDYDDEFDCTFAVFEFKFPDGLELPGGLAPAMSLREKTDRFLKNANKRKA